MVFELRLDNTVLIVIYGSIHICSFYFSLQQCVGLCPYWLGLNTVKILHACLQLQSEYTEYRGMGVVFGTVLYCAMAIMLFTLIFGSVTVNE